MGNLGWVLYWVMIADSAKHFFDVASNIFQTFTIIGFIAYVLCSWCYSSTVYDSRTRNEEEEKVDPGLRGWLKARKVASKLFWVSLSLCLITWMGYIFIPTKKDALIIVAGSAIGKFIASDSSARGIPAELTLLVREKLKSEINDLKNPLAQAEDTLKNKSAEELREIIKSQHK